MNTQEQEQVVIAPIAYYTAMVLTFAAILFGYVGPLILCGMALYAGNSSAALILLGIQFAIWSYMARF